jgi:hypothetical protein
MDLISFYLKESPNSDGRWLEEIWAWSDEDWELEHDFIQHLFPTDQASAFNADAPILDKHTIKKWHQDRLLQHNLRLSYERWLRYCGIERVNGTLHLAVRKPNVWGGFNHNWLRITRVLKSLTLLGLVKESQEFFSLLKEMRESRMVAVGDETWRFWSEAADRSGQGSGEKGEPPE